MKIKTNCLLGITFIVFLFAFAGVSYATTYLSENFDGVTAPALPAGWRSDSVFVGAAGFPQWQTNVGTHWPSGPAAHSGSNVAYFDSFSVSPGSSARLSTTSGLDTRSAGSLALTFWMYHDTIFTVNDRIQVQISTDMGSNWTNVGDPFPRYTGTEGWAPHVLDLSAFAGQPDVRIGFLGIGEYGNDCHIDDVEINGTEASAAGMYAVDDSANSLYRINTATGEATLVGALGQDLSYSGLAYDSSNGIMYVSDVILGGGSSYGLASVDLFTGAAAVIGGHSISYDISGLAYVASDNKMYGADNYYTNTSLDIIDLSTGVATIVGSFVNYDVGGINCLAYDADTDTLYGMGATNLYTINRSTGFASVVGPHSIGFDGETIGCEVDSETGALYAGDDYTGNLYRIDKTTGEGTLVGSTGIKISGLAYVPESIADQQILYGIDRASNLYTIDYVNGSTNLIGALGFSQASAFTINTSTGDAFASPGGANPSIANCLYGVSLTTGVATQVGCDNDVPGPFTDFAFHSNGIMYALGLFSDSDYDIHLCTINTATGEASDIGSTGDWTTGYGSDFVSDVLYMWEEVNGLSTLDLSDASVTTIGIGQYKGFPSELTGDLRIPDLAAKKGGVLYGVLVTGGCEGKSCYYLVTLDKSNGDITYVVPLPTGMQNLAFGPQVSDGCPYDSNKTAPGVCGCGIADIDSDSDGTLDCNDGCPSDATKTEPGACGCGIADADSDGDGIPDCDDGCPSDPAKTVPDQCGCGVADTDTDGDGTADCNDGCPNDATKTELGVCGCGVADTDTDGDGTADCNDGCPADALKTTPGVCGCGVADTDTDGDGTYVCQGDLCDNDPAKTVPGACGCGVADTDADSDGTPNCNDGCPNDPIKIATGVCGCGVADIDSDSDGTLDCNDNCLSDPAKTEPGICGCGVADTDSDSNGIVDCIDLPDLTGSWSSLKFNTKNNTCSGRLKVENIGSKNATALTVSYYLSDNGTDLGTLLATDTITGVRAGRSANSSFRYGAVNPLTGNWVIAVIDSDEQIIESDEDNNHAAQLIQ